MELRLPVIRGVIARRILVNFRVKPEAIRGLLPAPFRPRLVNGWAMAGICLIRLEQIRPAFLPAAMGIASENAAHRIAVEWGEGGTMRQGVFIPRRDTDSRVNQLAGGRVFPGVHHASDFRVEEANGRIQFDMSSRDGDAFIRLEARVAPDWPEGSVFGSLDEASAFYRSGACGWSPDRDEAAVEGMELRTMDWRVEPLAVERVESSFFQDERLFPRGSVEFDCALLMRGIHHEWHSLGTMKLAEPRPCKH